MSGRDANVVMRPLEMRLSSLHLPQMFHVGKHNFWWNKTHREMSAA